MTLHAFLSLFASAAMAVDTGNGGDTGGGCNHSVVLVISPEWCIEGEMVSIRPQMCTGEPLPEGTFWYLSWFAPGIEDGRDESVSPTRWLCPEVEVAPPIDGVSATLFAQIWDAEGQYDWTFGNVPVLDRDAFDAPTTSAGDPGCSGESSCSAGGRGGIGGSLGLLFALALAWVRRKQAR